jgi:hypothetical protein
VLDTTEHLPATEGPSTRQAAVRDRRLRERPGRDQKFAEPVALSSTQPTGRPLPRRASRLSLNLIALRARRSREPKRCM